MRGCWLTLQVFEFAQKLGAKLPLPEQSKFASVCSEMLDPVTCWAKYLEALFKAESTQALNEEDLDLEVAGGGPTTECDLLAETKKAFNKPTGMLLDVLLKLMRGVYLQDCRKLASDGFYKAMDGSAKDQCDLVRDLQVIVEHFEGSQKSVSLTTQVPELGLLQGLRAQGADAESAEDREGHWRTAQGERKKYINLSVPKSWSREMMTAAFRSSGKVYSHSGTLNASHRLICASADLFQEEGEAPWSIQSKPGKDWAGLVEFAASCSGSCDFVMLFDGRMREIRRMHALWMQH